MKFDRLNRWRALPRDSRRLRALLARFVLVRPPSAHFAVGAAAIGALAIGRLAVGAFAMKRGHVRALTVDTLDVRRLHIGELAIDRREPD